MDLICVCNNSGPTYSPSLPSLYHSLQLFCLPANLSNALCMTHWLTPGTSTWAWDGTFHRSSVTESNESCFSIHPISSRMHPYAAGPHSLPAHHLHGVWAALASSLPHSPLLWVHGCVHHALSGRQQKRGQKDLSMMRQTIGRKSVKSRVHYKASHFQNP